MRKAAVAGQFYPAEKEDLINSIKNMMENAEAEPSEKDIYGLLCPHAGYEYSGKAAASSYKAISYDRYATFVIMGPNHTGYGKKIGLTKQDFETPLGIAENDKEFSFELIKLYGESDDAHQYEHSIEVQLPFLQQIFKTVRIVPIVVSRIDYEKCRELGENIAKIAQKLNRKVCVIASSDLTHYGLSYQFLPFSGKKEEVKKKIYALDRKAIKLIEGMKSDLFFSYSKDITICGAGPITTAIEACKKLGAKKAVLLDYYTSGDISGDYENAVGYASMAMV